MTSWQPTAPVGTEDRADGIGGGTHLGPTREELSSHERPTAASGRKLNGARRTLDEMRPGERGLILAVGSDDERIHQRLLHLGMLRGRELVVVRRAPTGDPMEIRLLSYSLCLRRREASQVEVAHLP